MQARAVSSRVDLRPALWNGRRVLALRVRGTVMADESLRDGDYLIVEPGEPARDGQTAVVDLDGRVTVKRIFREPDGRVRLQPADPELLPLVLPIARIRIIGTVAGIFRRHGFGTRSARPPRRDAADRGTLDLTLGLIDQSLRQADREHAQRGGRTAERIRELARALRSLRDCYLRTRVPRLRAALLGEAGEIVQRLRRFGVEPAR
jgi:peptidase S24-like protein